MNAQSEEKKVVLIQKEGPAFEPPELTGVEDDRAALEESIAFQVGKDWGLNWREARVEARRLVSKGIKGTRVG